MLTSMINTAMFHLKSKKNIIFPEKAKVTFPDFDPCRAVNIIAIVSIPAIINMKETVLTHIIKDGDKIYGNRKIKN